MPLGFGGPFLSTGRESPVSIAPGGGQSGDAKAGNIGPVNVAGIFGSDAKQSNNSTLLLVGAVAIVAVLLLRR